jgi:hypothetical protein
MRLSRFVISVPVLLLAAQLAQPMTTAQAMGAEEATSLLAKTHAIDGKCGVLSPEARQDLKDLVARAELSLAEKASVSVARKAILSGRAAGKATQCDASANKLVNDVLHAARAAATVAVSDDTRSDPQADSQPQALAAAANEPVTTPEPEDTVAVAAVEPEPVMKKPVNAGSVIIKPKKPTNLAGAGKNVIVPGKKKANAVATYAVVAEKYYVARRCNNMRSGAINQLYKKVLANHQQALSAAGVGPVRAMLRQAEANAAGRSCS